MLPRIALFTLVTLLACVSVALAQDTPSTTQGQPGEKNKQQGADSSDAARSDEGTSQADAGPLTPEKVLNKLHQTNQEEIMMGKLALEKGTSEDIKRYGQSLINDHQKADEEVKRIAKAQNIQLTATPMHKPGDAEKSEQTDSAAAGEQDKSAQADQTNSADAKKGSGKYGAHGQKHDDHAAAMKRLQGLSGEEFDREFARVMAEDHKKVLSFLEQARKETQLAKLHKLIDQLKPALEKHEDTAQQIIAKSGGEESQSRTQTSRAQNSEQRSKAGSAAPSQRRQ